VSRARRTLAAVFAGDSRVWRVAALAAIPVLALLGYYLLKPRAYFTGTNSVEPLSYVAPAKPGEALCVPDLDFPAGTARVRMLLSARGVRPALTLTAVIDNTRSVAQLPAQAVPMPSGVEFPVPQVRSAGVARRGSLCVTAAAGVNWGGTPLPVPPREGPTLGGVAIPAKVSIWYLPPAGATSSYLARAGSTLQRASLFRPAPIGPWLYWIILVVVLPALALAAIRFLALATAGRLVRGAGAWLFLVAAVNFVCWALITPPFQVPDEPDHFAYTQSLVERGERPAGSPASPLLRWSSSEDLALEDTGFLTDHQVGDTKAPWSSAQEQTYKRDVATIHPRGSDGGGNETAASHGPVYYALLAPAYAVATSSPFSQLTLMRFASAVIGALTVLFTFLLVRELAPGRPWLAVLAALLVAFQPMYGFMSGGVNNDVGVNAGAAALEFLMIRILRRGITLRTGLATAVVAVLLPMVKGTALSIYPLLAFVVLLTLWRSHRSRDLRAWAGAGVGAGATAGLASVAFSAWSPAAVAGGAGGGGGLAANTEAVSEALRHIPDYFAYVWQVFLPRLSFMRRHFPPGPKPVYVIFVQRGWAALGWYVIFFPKWVYSVLEGLMIAAIPAGFVAAWRERDWLRRNWAVATVVLLAPVLVLVGFEAAYYVRTVHAVIPEFGRYEFPAIAPLAAIVVGILHFAGRRWALCAGTVLLVAMLALSYAAQLLELTAFYA
jgi:Predicted membrane protein (DUF2142)